MYARKNWFFELSMGEGVHTIRTLVRKRTTFDIFVFSIVRLFSQAEIPGENKLSRGVRSIGFLCEQII